ncbi:hypothetical protein MLD38_016941 [Melastoma candidum]|uniref:Uncharacterized protein n=1 Tax=Melastoma candidum TaxID=119954 RepID=A0ACB9QP22_9MYRT|nr:hypothetical protein MLD38_016941 [Melastoma candidum]
MSMAYRFDLSQVHLMHIEVEIRRYPHLSSFNRSAGLWRREGVIDPKTVLPSLMPYASPTEVQWHAKAPLSAGGNFLSSWAGSCRHEPSG